MINPLQPPDSHHLSAAIGWLGLGNYLEANEDLERITPNLRTHPDVLRIRCEIYLVAKKWNELAIVATALCEMVPKAETGWIHYSFSLHEMKRTKEARENLLRVVERFPDNWLMRYNLACYECQLGNLNAAKAWLHLAMDLGDREEIQNMMLEDPDLEPIWGQTGTNKSHP